MVNRSTIQNYKRVAEVWMDEYKEYLYLRRPKYRTLEVGDLSAQLEIRERLQCKSFDWFMKNIAFDLPKKYPPIEPPDFASGEVIALLFKFINYQLFNCLFFSIDSKQSRSNFMC